MDRLNTKTAIRMYKMHMQTSVLEGHVYTQSMICIRARTNSLPNNWIYIYQQRMPNLKYIDVNKCSQSSIDLMLHS